MSLQDRLAKLGACRTAVTWSRQFQTAPEAVAACDNGMWLEWLLIVLRVKLDEPVDTASRLPKLAQRVTATTRVSRWS